MRLITLFILAASLAFLIPAAMVINEMHYNRAVQRYHQAVYAATTASLPDMNCFTLTQSGGDYPPYEQTGVKAAMLSAGWNAYREFTGAGFYWMFSKTGYEPRENCKTFDSGVAFDRTRKTTHAPKWVRSIAAKFTDDGDDIESKAMALNKIAVSGPAQSLDMSSVARLLGRH